MAKISYTKLGLKSDQETKTIVYNEQHIEIKQKLSVDEKADLIDAIVSGTLTDRGFFNPFKLKIISDIEIVKAYTNISFTEKQLTDNLFKTYDALSAELLEIIFAEIPASELHDLRAMAKEVTEAITSYNNSIMGLLAQISQRYSNVNFELDKIAEALGDPSKLEMVKKMIENV